MKAKKAFSKPIAIMMRILLFFGSGLPIAAAAKNTSANFSAHAIDARLAAVHL